MKLYDDNKQLIDQTLHLLIGYAWVFGLSMLVPTWVAFMLLMAAAYVRELWQHDWDPSRMGAWSYVDLAYFALGGLLAW